MKHVALAMTALLISLCASSKLNAQTQGTLDKDSQYKLSLIMQDARNEVRSHYYDPKLHGLDWDARYQQYMTMAQKTRNLGEAFSVVAAFLSGLDDSHVFFIPPSRANRIEDGYRFACWEITVLSPKSGLGATPPLSYTLAIRFLPSMATM